MVVAACSGSAEPLVPDPGCAHVVEASIVPTGASYRVTATISSADTGWDKYADTWVVRTPDGFVLRRVELAHPHTNEQPFTRTLTAVTIRPGEDVVEIAARDSIEGFCGEIVVLDVPRSVDL